MDPKKTEVEADQLLPTSIDDLRGQTPDEMRGMIEVIDAHLRSLDSNDAGELRDMSEEEAVAEQLVEFAICSSSGLKSTTKWPKFSGSGRSQ